MNLEQLFEALLRIVALSFFIERALALVFETRWVIARLSGRGVKEPISFAVSLAVCRYWDFDAISTLFARNATQLWGHVLSAAIVAGGSKASIAFFHNVVGAMSEAEAERQKIGRGNTKIDSTANSPPLS